jgi:hypothetical protein
VLSGILLVKGMQDKKDDTVLQAVTIDKDSVTKEGKVALEVNPGVPCVCPLKISNVLTSDSASITLSYVFPEAKPQIATYLSVTIATPDKTFYDGKILEAPSKLVDSYHLAPSSSVTFSFTYLLGQDYPTSNESFDLSLKIESTASSLWS